MRGCAVPSAPVDGATTTELVERALAGEEPAWAALVERFQGVIWTASSSFRFDRSTRDDVFQLTCLRLLDHLGTIREPERLAGWLAVTARRECLRIVRDRARWQSDEGIDRIEAVSAGADAAMLRDETVRIVAAALDELDDACQQLLRLLVSEPPLGYESIAELLGRPIGSIGPSRARCLEKLGRRPSILRITDGAPASNTQEVGGIDGR